MRALLGEIDEEFFVSTKGKRDVGHGNSIYFYRNITLVLFFD